MEDVKDLKKHIEENARLLSSLQAQNISDLEPKEQSWHKGKIKSVKSILSYRKEMLKFEETGQF